MTSITTWCAEGANQDMDVFPRLLERKQAERDRIAADLQDRTLLGELAVAAYKRELRQTVKAWIGTALSFCAALGCLAGIALLMMATWR